VALAVAVDFVRAQNVAPEPQSLLGPDDHTDYFWTADDVCDADWIEIDNMIEANFADVRTWSFEFQLPQPDVHDKEVGAILPARLADEGGAMRRETPPTVGFRSATSPTCKASKVASHWPTRIVRTSGWAKAARANSTR
jgi:hypothetical protein